MKVPLPRRVGRPFAALAENACGLPQTIGADEVHSAMALSVEDEALGLNASPVDSGWGVGRTVSPKVSGYPVG